MSIPLVTRRSLHFLRGILTMSNSDNLRDNAKALNYICLNFIYLVQVNASQCFK